MVQDVGMGAADAQRHGLERHGLRAQFDQQFARGDESCGSAFGLGETLPY